MHLMDAQGQVYAAQRERHRADSDTELNHLDFSRRAHRRKKPQVSATRTTSKARKAKSMMDDS